MDLLQRMRVIGSGLVIVAYFITLHLDVVTGVIVHLTGMTISVPYFIKSRAWDVVIMLSFLLAISPPYMMALSYLISSLASSVTTLRHSTFS